MAIDPTAPRFNFDRFTALYANGYRIGFMCYKPTLGVREMRLVCWLKDGYRVILAPGTDLIGIVDAAYAHAFEGAKMVPEGYSYVALSEHEEQPGKAPADEPSFTSELADTINRLAKDNDSNTPDYILADFLNDVRLAFMSAVRRREQHQEWAGPKEAESEKPTSLPGDLYADYGVSGVWVPYPAKRRDPYMSHAGAWPDPNPLPKPEPTIESITTPIDKPVSLTISQLKAIIEDRIAKAQLMNRSQTVDIADERTRIILTRLLSDALFLASSTS